MSATRERYDLRWLSGEASIERRALGLPSSIRDMLARAVAELDPLHVYVFGSRVRGDFARHSDLDLAFDVPIHARARWARFVAEEPERFESLLSFDLVGLHECADSLRAHVLQHGILIHEPRIEL